MQFTYVQAAGEAFSPPVLQKIIFINVFYVYGSFLPSWIWRQCCGRIRIQIVNPNPDRIQEPHYIRIRIRIRPQQLPGKL